MNAYIGHPGQYYGVEEHRLIGGKGDGMRLFEIRSGGGLDVTVSASRCADLSRVQYKGINIGYFAPCGYVAPAYYDDRGGNFLRSFTAGFLTTCGLTAVGSPCVDEGEELPLHGRIGNMPAEQVSYSVNENEICLKAEIRQAALFGECMTLHREIKIPVGGSKIQITDTVENETEKEMPLMLLYHMNMGYPFLSEAAKLEIPSDAVAPRDARAAEGIDTWNELIAPVPNFVEQCYYHSFNGEKGVAVLRNPKVGVQMAIRFDTAELGCFTEWKQMGTREYVLGLEPGNCTPDGRDVLRKEGRLEFLAPNASKTFHVEVEFGDCKE